MGYSYEVVDIEFDCDDRNQRSYTQVVQLLSDAKIGAATAASLVGIQPLDAYINIWEFDTSARCNKINAKMSGTAKDGKQWDITYNYAPLERPSLSTNPLNDPLVYGSDWEHVEIPAEQDAFGTAVRNSAGDSYDPTIMTTRKRYVRTVTRNEATEPVLLAQYYQNTLNMYPFYGAPRGCVLCRSIRPTQQFDQNIGVYFSVTYEFVLDLKGFKVYVLNQGKHERVVKSGKTIKVHIRDENNVPVTSPVLLDRTGKKLPPNGTPVFGEYQLEDYADFSVFTF